MKLDRKEITKSVFLSKITDSRFKQNKISISFLTQLKENTASVNAVIPRVLTASCKKFPDLRSLNGKLSELYAARLSGDTDTLGDTQEVSVSVKTIDSRYALEGEDIMVEGVNILLGCLFEPLLESGNAFKSTVVETEKQACIDQIEAELNDKRVYAIHRTRELMYKGEPAAIQAHGTIEGVTAVTAETAYAAYQTLLKNARVEIICIGCNNFSSAETAIVDAFAKLNRGETEDCYSSKSPLKQDVLENTETMDVNQSKMLLGFKADCNDKDALSLMTKIYGGSATSKLFENVREKMSLCYYCSAKLDTLKWTMYTECGVEKDNIEKARNEILRQLDLMKSGDFTDEEMNHALLSLQNDLRVVNDSLRGLKSWYLNYIYRCDVITPEEAIKRYETVTRERIVNAAKSVSLDTVYVLTDGEN